MTSHRQRRACLSATAVIGIWAAGLLPAPAQAQAERKPNIVMLVSDDTGWGDLGAYGGGEGRGQPTPNLDRIAREGMQFWSFYGQPSCTPGRAAMQTGRIPNRSGMTTVAFQGEGGGLPAAEWTLASVLKQGGYRTFFVGKWHLGEADYAMPTAHGYDEMKNVTLYHLNAYTYGDPKWNPDLDPAIIRMYQQVTKGVLEGKAGEPAREVRKLDGEGIPFADQYTEEATLAYLEQHAKDEAPFFVSVNFAKNHQPNLPHPDFAGKSMAKSKYADSVVELDTRIGRIMDKIRELGIQEDTFVFYTVDNGAWQDVFPDAGYTPFRGTKGTVREGGSRVPALAWWPGKIPAGVKTHEIAGGLDLMATFASVAGVALPDKDLEGQSTIFDSYDLSPLLFGTGKSGRTSWLYFTEDELLPGAIRVGQYKAVYNLRGDDGAMNGGLEVGTNEGWKGPSKYVATVPRLYNLWQDPQERYDVFMTNFVEKTVFAPVFAQEMQGIMDSYVRHPPRPMQGLGYTGPITISDYQRFQHVRGLLEQQGLKFPPAAVQ
jgi:arylsulfatase